MNLVSDRDGQVVASFADAVLSGTPKGGGLFIPPSLPHFTPADGLLAQSFVERSVEIAHRFFPEAFSRETWHSIIEAAFDFPVDVKKLDEDLHILELFHGPTLAFKDFGARFMAQVLRHLARDRQSPITVLTATSGDTGAAVAHAFYGVEGVQVCVLYPAGRISPLQEKLFCGLGKNITTLRIDGAFDDCQAMVKRAFANEKLVKQVGLTSANSINFSRLLAQCFYYFEGLAQLQSSTPPWMVVPSGNFGNLTAGLYAREMGLEVAGFIAATNANDVVPAYLKSGEYRPRASVATPSNAMDVGNPSNWARIHALYDGDHGRLSQALEGYGASDAETLAAMQTLYQRFGYVADPHTAVAYHVWQAHGRGRGPALLLSTAHPAKFLSTVEETLQVEIGCPPALAAVRDGVILSEDMGVDQGALERRVGGLVF